VKDLKNSRYVLNNQGEENPDFDECYRVSNYQLFQTGVPIIVEGLMMERMSTTLQIILTGLMKTIKER